MTSTVKFSDRVAQRLTDENIVWLTTITAKEVPAPTPVWFLLSDGQIVIFSQPDTGKLRHIAANANVALNLNSDAHGGDVAVLNGTAAIDPAGPTAEEWERYAAKYATGFPAINLTAEQFRDSYSVLVRFIPQRVRSW